MKPCPGPSFSPRWWSAATPDVVAQTYRTAQAWKNDSPVAAGAVVNLDDQLAARFGVDTAALTVDAAGPDVAAQVAADLADRAERQEFTQSYRDRGFAVVDDRPFGRGFIPTWDLRQSSGADVDQATIDVEPKHWAVQAGRNDLGELVPEYFCTDPDAAGLTRPVPPLHLVYEDWWWEMAAEHQIAKAHEQLMYNGATYGVAHVRGQISRRYGVDAQKFAGTPDDLHARLAAVVAERDKAPVTDKTDNDRRDAAAAITASSASLAHQDARGDLPAPTPTSPGDAEQSDTDLAVQWAKTALPRDAERAVYGNGARKTAAEQTITTAWAVEQAKAWALNNAPALAAQFSQSEASANREQYLTARTELLDEWAAAGRPKADLDPRGPLYDSRERRATDAEAMLDAGIDNDIVDARMIADVQQAKPIIDALNHAGDRQPSTGQEAPTHRRERSRSGLDTQHGMDK
ncbi:hypothetical protein [Rhodococcoides corynebacterioides]|uniref:hypothetical protein n=1 Tax=Rhodococcoides corynebacterioides TaxID=53972 RepID=UPI001C9A87A6|nr:hypothetical protein [Rhodococcus corynebacterioides]MBY6351831.1 hypothetical protein [Rhodococcus corynebacterioides]